MIVLNLAIRKLLFDLRLSNIRLWMATHIALATYLLLVNISQVSIGQFLQQNLASTLGADTVIELRKPLDKSQLSQVEHLTTSVGKKNIYDVTISNKERWVSITLSAVDHGYPVQGEIIVNDGLGKKSQQRQLGPSLGEIWLDESIIAKTGFSLGDQVLVGNTSFTFTQVLVNEPDRLLTSMAFKPRAMVHADAFTLSSSNLKASEFKYLLAHGESSLSALKNLVSDDASAKVISTYQGQHPLAGILERVFNFIGLISVVLFILVAVSLDATSQKNNENQQKFYATAMSLGLSKFNGLLAWGVYSLLLFTVIIVVSAALALLGATILVEAAQFAFPNLTIAWSVSLISEPLGLLAILYLSSMFPLAVILSRVSVLNLIREKSYVAKQYLNRVLSFLIGAIAIVYFYSDNIRLTLYILIAVFVTAVVILASAKVLFAMSGLVTNRTSNLFAISITSMKQRLASKTSQVVSIGSCVFLLVFTSQLSENFARQFERYYINNDGNIFIEHATSQEKRALVDWTEQTGSELVHLAPFQFANLVSINQQPLLEIGYGPSESYAKVQNRIRLTWSEKLPKNKAINQGDWANTLTLKGLAPISVYEEVAEDLGLNIGDTLTFAISQQKKRFEVVAIHRHLPQHGLVSFWFMLPENTISPEAFYQQPSYMGSMKLNEQGEQALASFWGRHPTLQMKTVEALIDRVNLFLKTLDMSVLFITGFLAAICTLVIWSGISASVENDRKRFGLMLSMGASKLKCIKLTLYEWFITAVVANIGALAGALLALELVYQVQFGASFKVNWWTTIEVFFEVTTIVAAFGLVLSINSLSVKPIALLNGDIHSKSSEKEMGAARYLKMMKHWRKYVKVLRES